jgi:hypothetical protein
MMLDNGIDARISKPISIIAGAPYALIESSIVGKIAAPLKATFNKAIRESAERVTQGFVKTLGKDWATNVTQEALQAAIQQEAVEIGRWIDSDAVKKSMPKAQWDVLKAAWQGAVDSAIPMAGLLGTTHGIKKVSGLKGELQDALTPERVMPEAAGPITEEQPPTVPPVAPAPAIQKPKQVKSPIRDMIINSDQKESLILAQAEDIKTVEIPQAIADGDANKVVQLNKKLEKLADAHEAVLSSKEPIPSAEAVAVEQPVAQTEQPTVVEPTSITEPTPEVVPVKKDSPLRQEALKYATADEFVVSQAIKEYSAKEATKILTDARNTGKRKNNQEVFASDTSKEPMVLVNFPIEKIGQDELDTLSSASNKDRVSEYSKNKIDTPINLSINKDGSVYIPDGGHRVLAAIKRGDKTIRSLIPKSQLTDIWNEAQEVIPNEKASKETSSQDANVRKNANEEKGQVLNVTPEQIKYYTKEIKDENNNSIVAKMKKHVKGGKIALGRNFEDYKALKDKYPGIFTRNIGIPIDTFVQEFSSSNKEYGINEDVDAFANMVIDATKNDMSPASLKKEATKRAEQAIEQDTVDANNQVKEELRQMIEPSPDFMEEVKKWDVDDYRYFIAEMNLSDYVKPETIQEVINDIIRTIEGSKESVGVRKEQSEEKTETLELKQKTDEIEKSEAEKKLKKGAMKLAEDRTDKKFNPQQEEKTKLFDATQDGETRDLFQKNSRRSTSGSQASTSRFSIDKAEKQTKTEAKQERFKLSERITEVIKKYAGLFGENYNPRGTLGVFKTESENIFLTAKTNLSVAVHEVTHYLDKKLGITKAVTAKKGETKSGAPIYSQSTKEMRKQLTNIYIEHYPGGKKDHPLKVRVQEGIAVFFQNYIMTPTKIRESYPYLYQQFILQDGKYYDPKMQEFIKDSQSIIQDYQSQDDLSKVGARVVDAPQQKKGSFLSPIEQVLYRIDDKYPAEKIDKGMSNIVRMLDYIPRLSRHNLSDLQFYGVGIGKFKLGFGENTYVGFDVKGEIEVKHNFNWDSIVKEEQDVAGFDNWLVARAAYFDFAELDSLREKYTELLQEYKQQLEETDMPDKKLLKELQKAKEKYLNHKGVVEKDANDRGVVTRAYNDHKERFADTAKKFDILVKEDLKLLNHPRVGLISDETYKELSEKQGYATRKRDIYNEILGDMEGALLPATAMGGKKVKSMIRRTGSEKDIISPLFMSMLNHQEIFKKASRQMVYNKIYDVSSDHVNIFEKLTLEPKRESDGRITYPQEKDPNIMMAFKDGKRYPLLVDKEVKAMFDYMLTPQTVGLVEKIFTTASRVFTQFTTGLYLPFAFQNFLSVDQITAAANTTTKYKPLITPIKELFLALADTSSENNKYLREYLMLGGDMHTFIALNELSPQEAYTAIRREANALDKVVSYLNDGLDIIKFPVQTSEMMTRAAEYMRARKRGDSQWDAMELAGRISAPFHHKGFYQTAFERGIKRSIPYLNATINANAQYARSVHNKDTRKRALFVMAMATTAAVAGVLSIIGWGDDDQKRQLKDKEAGELARYIFIPHPNGKDLLKFRVGQEFMAASTVINMAIMEMTGETEYEFFEYVKGVTAWMPDQFNPTDPARMLVSWLPQVVVPATQVALNKKLYPRIRDLEPDFFKYLPKSERFFESTSDLSKYLAPKIGLSPVMLDVLILGYGGRALNPIIGKETSNPFTSKYYFQSGRSIVRYYAEREKNKEDLFQLENNPEKVSDVEADKIMETKDYVKRVDKLLKSFREAVKEKDTLEIQQIRNEILDTLDIMRK